MSEIYAYEQDLLDHHEAGMLEGIKKDELNVSVKLASGLIKNRKELDVIVNLLENAELTDEEINYVLKEAKAQVLNTQKEKIEEQTTKQTTSKKISSKEFSM